MSIENQQYFAMPKVISKFKSDERYVNVLAYL